MDFDKGASYSAVRLWIEGARGATGLWEDPAILFVQFGAFAVLVGFVVQALVSIFGKSSVKPAAVTNDVPGMPVGNSEGLKGPPSVGF